MEIEVQLSRIAQAFERIADSLERVEHEGLSVDLHIHDGNVTVQGPLLVQHEFPHDVPLGLLHIEPNQRAIKVELSNCTDTELPFAVQIND